jgi:hypothetical protein
MRATGAFSRAAGKFHTLGRKGGVRHGFEYREEPKKRDDHRRLHGK